MTHPNFLNELLSLGASLLCLYHHGFQTLPVASQGTLHTVHAADTVKGEPEGICSSGD